MCPGGRELHDVFEVQDEVTRAIVVVLAAHVKRAEIERTLLKPPAAWEAYEYYLRGTEAFFLYMSRLVNASRDAGRHSEMKPDKRRVVTVG